MNHLQRIIYLNVISECFQELKRKGFRQPNPNIRFLLRPPLQEKKLLVMSSEEKINIRFVATFRSQRHGAHTQGLLHLIT